ncbi:PASTA domain-containing protein [Streptomyces sp. XD-27]|uniref:PASTA domain-containing protein n=1 Tax=Streptomyces sp. XD-27 TaxID=3062779 RepID=UPI0026F4176D|nr:PASTA domain-containing protein [Streptomyces sp. XD-27]WKX69921.1 PASTA domain-containing protein [Streptomyces sp. XD-27]
MRSRAATAVISVVVLLSLTACGGDDSNGTPEKTETKSPGAPSPTEKARTAELPNLVGKGLQSAQDAAQAAGFSVLTSHDSLGRGRNQILDRNWKVCFQKPKLGQQPTDVQIDLGAVKLEENCPATDSTEQRKAGAKMPDFQGKSVTVAREALDPSTSLTVKDASGQDRNILVESNWKVCGQEPQAGANLTGQPVTLTAVKFEESCP